MRRFSRSLAAAAVSLGLLSGCAGMADALGYNTQALNAHSAQSYQQLRGQAQRSEVLDTRSATARRVQRVFQRMKPHAEAANRTGVPFQWEMMVIRSKEMNAWAMPGGKMAVYTGLVEALNLTDDEIAAVVGHEMTHALLEHSKQAVGQKVLTGLALDIGGRVVASQTGISSEAIGLSQGLLAEYGIGLPYSRHHEREADSGGMLLMAQAGYDPRAAVTVWEKMAAYQGSGNALTGMLSTHPSNQSRIEELRRQLPSVLPVYEQNRRRR